MTTHIIKTASEIPYTLELDIYKPSNNGFYKSYGYAMAAINRRMKIRSNLQSGCTNPEYHIPACINLAGGKKGWLIRHKDTAEYFNGCTLQITSGESAWVQYPKDYHPEHSRGIYRSFSDKEKAIAHIEAWTREGHTAKLKADYEGRQAVIQVAVMRQEAQEKAKNDETDVLGDTIENLIQKDMEKYNSKCIAARKKSDWAAAREAQESLRQLRLNLFDAEDRAYEAYYAGNSELFNLPMFESLNKALQGMKSKAA